MSRYIRALLISAAATGVVAAVAYAVRQRSSRPAPASAPPPPNDSVQVDADRMTDEERDLLVREMAEQL
jgi:uncharacterized membrane protein YebE (DUF533 family)